MPRKLRLALVLLLATPVAVFVYVTVVLTILHRARDIGFSYEHAGTDLTFASSDGVWRGEEDMMKGRQFADVLVDFELYRLRSNQSAVRLLRTKPWKQPWQWAWWFDRRKSPKWKVPYVPLAEVPHGSGQLPAANAVPPAELAQARREAEAYLQTLR